MFKEKHSPFLREAWNAYLIFQEMWKDRFIFREKWSRHPPPPPLLSRPFTTLIENNVFWPVCLLLNTINCIYKSLIGLPWVPEVFLALLSRRHERRKNYEDELCRYRNRAWKASGTQGIRGSMWCMNFTLIYATTTDNESPITNNSNNLTWSSKIWPLVKIKFFARLLILG